MWSRCEVSRIAWSWRWSKGKSIPKKVICSRIGTRFISMTRVMFLWRSIRRLIRRALRSRIYFIVVISWASIVWRSGTFVIFKAISRFRTISVLWGVIFVTESVARCVPTSISSIMSFCSSSEGERRYCTNDFLWDFNIAYASRLSSSSLFVSWNKVRWNDLFCDSRIKIFAGFVLLLGSRGYVNISWSFWGESRVCVWNCFVILFSSRVRSCVRIVSLAISSVSTSFTSVSRVLKQ